MYLSFLYIMFFLANSSNKMVKANQRGRSINFIDKKISVSQSTGYFLYSIFELV